MEVHVNPRINELREAGDWPGVEQLSRDILNRTPDDVFALRALSQALEQQSKTDELPKIWRKLADLEDRPGPVEKALAAHYLQQEKKESAVQWYRRALESFVRARDDSQIEEIWLELCELDPSDLEWFLSISDRVAGSRRKEQASILLQMLIPYYEKNEQWEDVLTILRRAAALTPQDIGIRDSVIKALRARHAGAVALEHVLDHCGMRQTGSILESLKQAERFIPYSDGEACYHPDWGVGLVKKLDLFSERVTIDFERKKNHEITVDLAQEILEPLHHRDIRAAWVREPERVSRLVEEDPAEIVRMALVSCGRKATAGELKQRLCGSVIPEKKWSRWWANATAVVKKDPFISLSGSTSKAYILRKEPRSTEEEWMESFEKKRNPIEKIDLVLSYLRNTKPSNYSVELLRRFSLMFFALAKERRNPAIRLEIYLTLEDLNRSEPSIDGPAESMWDEILAGPAESVDLLLQLAYPDHQWRMWERLRERYPDAWSEICGTLILSHQSLIRDRLTEWLRAERHEAILSDLAKKVALEPREYPEAFAWFSDQVLLGNRQDVSMGIDAPVLFERLLMLVDFLNDRAKRVEKTEAAILRASAAQVRNVLKKDDFAILDKILPNIDRSVALSLYKRANLNSGLDVGAREKITRRILARFPGLLGSLETGSDADRPTEFLCTYPAYEAHRKRLQQIIEQELPRVTDQIEEARKHGDLSENAEYHAAKDKQKTLYGEAADLRDQLQLARPTDLSRIVPDEVKFGVKVRITNSEGEGKVYTVLGPWESIPEQDILSYQAPFMRAFLGKKTGDIVEIDLPNRKGIFTVQEIEPIPAELYPPAN